MAAGSRPAWKGKINTLGLKKATLKQSVRNIERKRKNGMKGNIPVTGVCGDGVNGKSEWLFAACKMH